MKSEKKRVNVTIGEEMYNKLKKKADEMGSSVPSVLVVYASQAIQQEEAINSMSSIMAKLGNMGNMEQIKAMEQLKKEGL